VGDFGDWGTCAANCSQSRVFVVSQPAQNGGAACAFANGFVDWRNCTDGACVLPCVGDFDAWASCLANCTQSRAFAISRPSQNGGAACAHASGFTEWRNCTDGACVLPCVGDFGDWGACAANCSQNRAFAISRPAQNGGAACAHSHGALEWRDCTDGACVLPCVGDFGDWGACAANCSQSRTFAISRPAQNDGAACPFANGFVDWRSCTDGACVLPCVGDFGAWASCLANCTQSRAFAISRPAQNGGAACAHSQDALEWRNCIDGACVLPCAGDFGDWGACAANCTRSRVYAVSRAAQNGGAACAHIDGHVDWSDCTDGACVLPCVGAFGNWTACAANCTQSREFAISRPAQNDGAACEFAAGFRETRACSSGACARDCEGAFGDWSACSETCAQSRAFSVTRNASGSGAPCGLAHGATEQRGCTTGRCVAPCEGAFSNWSACTAACVRARMFTVTDAGGVQGAACAHASGFVETETCLDGACVVACDGAFTEWAECGPNCTQSRVFNVSRPARNGGQPCAFEHGREETRRCTDGAQCSSGADSGSSSAASAFLDSATKLEYAAPAIGVLILLLACVILLCRRRRVFRTPVEEGLDRLRRSTSRESVSSEKGLLGLTGSGERESPSLELDNTTVSTRI
jgi:hypothetical protein